MNLFKKPFSLEFPKQEFTIFSSNFEIDIYLISYVYSGKKD